MAKTKEEIPESIESTPKKKCGIIMPISPHPDYPVDHWKDVYNILVEAVEQTEFEAQLVSDDVAVGLIHNRIVTNIYNNEIVICDVSSKNPNVMFELGLRIAFDKPTIIIKDESTGFSFDTSVIEHIPYPSSLRFSQIVKFKEELIRRIKGTYQKSISDSTYSPFLKSFGKSIIPTTLHQQEITEGKYIISQLEKLNQEIKIIRFDRRNTASNGRIHRAPSLAKFLDFKMAVESYENIFDTISFEAIAKDPDITNMLKSEMKTRGYELSTGEILELLSTYLSNLNHNMDS